MNADKKPIVVIEDNYKDRELFETIFSELNLPNELICFDSCYEAENYLTSEKIRPFLIFSDVDLFHKEQSAIKNMSKVLNSPCIFFTTVFDHCFVIDYNSKSKQSYFITPYRYEKFKEVIEDIVAYWRKPNIENKDKN